MRVWFPDYYTEAHRSDERKADLLSQLRQRGVDCKDSPVGCDLAFCGSIFRADAVRESWPKSKPVVHYNWDLYPHVVETRTEYDWKTYLLDLRAATAVLVPNRGTAYRTEQMTGRKDSRVVLAPVKLWKPYRLMGVRGRNRLPPPREYALDVMREYPWDKGSTYPHKACQDIGMKLVRTQTRTEWEEFKWLVANAAVLVSTCDEASTGGLTLLEGYAHGVPVVASDSELNGASEYFGDRATYFRSRDPEPWRHLATTMARAVKSADYGSNAAWVREHYSDARFAENLKTEFARCLSRPT